MVGEPNHPPRRSYAKPHTKAWSALRRRRRRVHCRDVEGTGCREDSKTSWTSFRRSGTSSQWGLVGQRRKVAPPRRLACGESAGQGGLASPLFHDLSHPVKGRRDAQGAASAIDVVFRGNSEASVANAALEVAPSPGFETALARTRRALASDPRSKLR